MQNSTTPPQEKEFDPIADLIERAKLAYKVFTAKKAIVVVENELFTVNTGVPEAFEISNIISDALLEASAPGSKKKVSNLIASA